MSKIITAIVGAAYMIYGHYELTLETQEEIDEYESMSDKEKKEYIRENGDFLVDDHEIDDIGDINTITVQDVK